MRRTGISQGFIVPTLADLDGQIDTTVVGDTVGTLQYFSYDGGQFIKQLGDDTSLEGLTVEFFSASEFVDLDGDGLPPSLYPLPFTGA